MPRFYLILFILLCQNSIGQKQLHKLIAHADAQVQVLDYIEALKYYQQALELEPNSIELHWKIAQTNALFKDYRTAARFFLKVYQLDSDGQLYPEAQLNYAQMLKQQALYKEALAQFKEVKRFFSENKKSYGYLKANQEVIACNWVLKQLKYNSDDAALKLIPHKANTIDAEFAHAILNNSIIYSALKADSIGEDQELVFSKNYHLNLYQFSDVQKGIQPFLSLTNSAFEYGNLSIAPDSSFAFCSECQRQNNSLQCRIIRLLPHSSIWTIDTLFQSESLKGNYHSMPTIFELNDTLRCIFAAKNVNGMGGIDLYFGNIDPNGQFFAEQNLTMLNSIENEVSPWFDPLTQRLYFSSTWHSGYGGYDIFYSALQSNGSFGPPINLGMPFNGSANDLYFFCNGDTAYLSSNRLGSLYASHPTCCSDIFYQDFLRPKQLKEKSIDSIIVELPIRLYFENDHPNPKSTSENTDLSYEETYYKYKSQYPEYLQKVVENIDSLSAVQVSNALDTFFIQEVDQGMKDLALFKQQVWDALQTGQQISIVVRGFASPLAKSDYNVHLTKRRIASIINYFEEIDGGKFAPYMQTNPICLQFIEEPMGEFKANKDVSDDYYDQRNSVYSKNASLERRIEIIALKISTFPKE